MEQKFRSAFNGFNRQDVVDYLEFLSGKYNAKINELTTDNEILRQQIVAAKSDSQPQKDTSELESKIASVTSERDALLERCAQLEAQLSDKAVDAAPAAAPVSVAADELEIYRRAERTEREARERASEVRQQTEALLRDVSQQLESAGVQMDDIIRQANSRLSALSEAVDNTYRCLMSAASEIRDMQKD